MNRMPWGKYVGHQLSEIPGSYLFWLIEEADKLPPSLRSAIESELLSRLPSPPPPSTGFNPAWFASWYRRAALCCHPDHGGSTRAMAIINELREVTR